MSADSAGLCWIGNHATAGTGVRTRLVAPATGVVLAEYSQAGSEQVDQAIGRAVGRFASLSGTPAYERRDWLVRIAGRLTTGQEELAHLISRSVAKPIRDARTEVLRAAATFQLASEEATRAANGEVISLEQTATGRGRMALVRRFPRGPVLAITPFNFPLNLVAHKVAPALALGCPVVLKPAPQGVLVALELARMAAESGVPEDALQVVPCAGETVFPFVADARIGHVTFTGSADVGWKLRAKTPGSLTLELGGNAGVLIDETADMEWVLRRCLLGAFSYAGQVCISVQRIYVLNTCYREFSARLAELAMKLRLGPPEDETSDLSCLISESAAVRVETWIQEALDAGARALVRGERHGNWLGPTVLADVRRECRVCQEEVFGPVVMIAPVPDWEAGLAALNDSNYGLQAGYFTRDIRRLLAAFERLEVGGLVGDDVPTFRSDTYPYGGVKGSGIGREGVRYAMEEMSERRVLVLPPA